MPITRDLRELLAVAPGREPDADPDIAGALLRAWAAAQSDDHVRSSTAPFFASDGAGCARRASYDYLQRVLEVDDDGEPIEPSNPPGIPDIWRFALGNDVHDKLQEPGPALGFGNEVRAVLTDDDGNDLVSCRADMYDEDLAIVVEIKSYPGYKFKLKTTTFKGAPEGPDFSNVVQLALTTKALRSNGKPVERGVIVAGALENIGVSMARDFADTEVQRSVAQWSYTVDELVELADSIIAHLLKIKRALDEGLLPPRVFKDPEIPAQAVVVHPKSGRWEVRTSDGTVLQSATTWMCDYCRWRDQCIKDHDEGI